MFARLRKIIILAAVLGVLAGCSGFGIGIGVGTEVRDWSQDTAMADRPAAEYETDIERGASSKL